MKTLKYLAFGLLGIILLAAISGTFVSLRVKKQVSGLFKMNKKLQEQGYYMAEFEFHMLGFSYDLGKGNYFKALKGVSDYNAFLSDTNKLVKIPEFKSKKEEIDFYLGLQNPKTGAFMDESVPFCAYLSNTENMLLHLEALHDSTTGPFELKYPLRFLDEINTPKKLVDYLDDISYMNQLGAKFPQTSFHFARDIINDAQADNVIERNNFYHFSPEWKHTLLKWMYDFQDPETGLWGPKHIKSGKLLKKDVMNTYSILSIYRTSNGEDIYGEFPLKYSDKLIKSTIAELKKPIPEDDDLSWVHEWNLQQAKGIKMLLACLWSDASENDRKNAQEIIADFIDFSFDKYYVEKDGAFSYYPNSEHASIDGISNMIYKKIGALSASRQKRYWGGPEENAADLGCKKLEKITERDFESLGKMQDINSWRIYTTAPDFDALYSDVRALVYPQKTKVLDVTELIPNIKQWTETSDLSTGNWKSMVEIKNEFAPYDIKKPLIYRNEFPFEQVNRWLNETSKLYIIGFDKLQIPRFIVSFEKNGNTQL